MLHKPQNHLDFTSVYIIAQTTGLDLIEFRKTRLEWFFKIGISNNPERRKTSLNGGSVNLELISEYEFSTRAEAKNAEKLIHKMLYASHHKNEWFSLSHDELKLLDEVICIFLNGGCHYYEKEYFLTPKLTQEELLNKCHLPMDEPETKKPFKP
jgi:hypothetical protein